MQADLTTWLPDELWVKILGYCDVENETHSALSRLNKRIYNLVSWSIRTLCVTLPATHDYPPDLLTSLVRRYPHLQRMSLGPSRAENSTLTPFERYRLYFENFISALRTDPTFLQGVTEFSYSELGGDSEFHAELFQAIAHLNLKSFEIKASCRFSSSIGGAEIQSLAVNSWSLKRVAFVGGGSCSPNMKKVDFSQFTALQELHLMRWRGDIAVLESLPFCEKLTMLVLEYLGVEGDKVVEVLCQREWKLTHLELMGLSLGYEQIEQLKERAPQLVFFHVNK